MKHCRLQMCTWIPIFISRFFMQNWHCQGCKAKNLTYIMQSVYYSKNFGGFLCEVRVLFVCFKCALVILSHAHGYVPTIRLFCLLLLGSVPVCRWEKEVVKVLLFGKGKMGEVLIENLPGHSYNFKPWQLVQLFGLPTLTVSFLSLWKY